MAFLDEAFDHFKDYLFPFAEHERRAERLRNVFPYGEWVRSTREARFLRLEDVHAGVSPSRLSRIERDEMSVTLETLAKVARALDCELVWGFKPKRPFARAIFDKVLPFVAHRPRENPKMFANWVATQMQHPDIRRKLGWPTNKGGLGLEVRYLFQR